MVICMQSSNDSIASRLRSRQKIGMFLALGTPVALVVLLAIYVSQKTGLPAAFGICAIILLTAASVGAAFGFLFALPRIVSRSDATLTAGTNNGVSAPDQNATQVFSKRYLGSNTNLEKVSDWLTTMIVGVGLTQLSSINRALYSFRLFIRDTARVFQDAHGGNAGTLPSVGPMILVFGAVVGFLFAYLYTRIIISSLLDEVERDLETIPQDIVDSAQKLANSVPGVNENVTLGPIATGETPSVYELIELMGSLLYQPGRYQDVLELASKLSVTSATNRAEYWLYQAAAFGQKHHAAKERGGPSTELESSRDNAMDCARRAVKLDASMRTRLWFISDPDGEDDDLADFRDDPEFLKITGRWRKPPSPN
jgi:hypothetical protein